MPCSTRPRTAKTDTHRLLVGPHNSTDPEDGHWAVIADSAAMHNTEPNGEWTQGLSVDLSDYSGQGIRIAFHYGGLDADGWSLDDLCLGRTPVDEWPTSCFWQESWDEGVEPLLPSGWLVVDAADHVNDPIVESNWKRLGLNVHSSPYNAESPWSARERQSQYLVSPPILLP